MKILYVTQSLGKGGAERLVLDLAHMMINLGHIVKIVPLNDLNDYKELSKNLDIEVCHSNVQLSITGKSKIDVDAFEQIVDTFQPDIIHSHTYKPELVSREKQRKGIAYFTHVHADFPEFAPFNFSLLFHKKLLANYYERKRIFKKYKQINNQFITISKYIDFYLKKQLPISWHASIHMVPNGIDIQKFRARPKFLNTQEKIRFISIGRLYQVKNHIYLIKSMAILKNLHPLLDWELTILGEGPERPKLESMIVEMDLKDQVFLPGIIDDVENWLKRSHIYLHSAISEPFGLVLCEAMAAALPVISLDARGNRDLIVNEKCGYLLPQSSEPIHFSKVISSLINDPVLYTEMSNEAIKRAETFSIKNCADNLLQLYSEAVKLNNNTKKVF